MSKVPDAALSEFYAECEEILQRVSSDLSKIEQGDFSKDILDGLYRDMHTLKGTAQLFGFRNIGLVSHTIEAAMEPVRQGKMQLDHKLIDLIYLCLDFVGRVLKKPDLDLNNDPSLSEELSRLLPKLMEVATSKFDGSYQTVLDSTFLTHEGKLFSLDAQASAEEVTGADLKTVPETAREAIATSFPQINVLNIQTPQKPKTEKTMQSDDQQAEATSIRVQVSLLDKLMNLVGEMVLTRNQVLQFAKVNESGELSKLTQRLDIVTTELQDNVMKTRMQPIGNVFTKFQRLVRDLARELDKSIELHIQGAETELDKSLVEAIKDPLTHIVRNACDHGLETTTQRKATGKNPQGNIFLKAYHEGGQIIIEVSDDGAGLDPVKLKNKAIQKKIISAEEAASLTAQEAHELIFLPGFSTAEQVTAVSGRGVGMDVVRTNVEKVGGTIDIASSLSQGTTIRLRIPLTLAIVPAMIIRTGNECFAIPQIKLQELLRVDTEESGHRIEVLQGQKFYRLRDQLLPLLSSHQIMHPIEKRADPSVFNIVVLNAEPHAYGLIVDEIKDTADIVVKPLPNFMKKGDLFSGATVMGDGSVSLIVDTQGIAQHSMFKRSGTLETSKTKLEEKKLEKNIKTVEAEYLIFDLKSKTHFAIPLALVFRLEEFKSSQVEQSGDDYIVKYRGSLLHLVDTAQFLGAKSQGTLNEKENIFVIVVSKNNRYFGFVVNSIVDIVSSSHEITPQVKDQYGLLGNIILENQTVLTIIDGYSIIDLASGKSVTKGHKSKTKVSILLLEDTAFFVKQITRTLESAGHSVVHVENGDEALKALESSDPSRFDLIVSDIEMPKMNGFEFAQKLRSLTKFKQIPLVALTTRFRLDDQAKGKEVGFDLYLEKLKADELILGIDQLMGGKHE